jgi:hypothetical protein
MEFRTTMKIPPSLCVKCRGAKMLCGLSYCPVSIGHMIRPRFDAIKGNELNGSSPPSVFVGRFGYPKVMVYPSTPPVYGDTSVYENPAVWLNMDLEEFISMRLSIMRGGRNISVMSASDPDNFVQSVQLIGLSSKPTEVEMVLDRSLDGKDVVLSEYSPPMGPAAPLSRIKIGNAKLDNAVERVYGDTDLKSNEAMKILYGSGVEVSRIARILSLGALGKEKDRKMVPTRWSITAADKNLSDQILARVKRMPLINEFWLYTRKVSGNLFAAIISPRQWLFEWGEAWFPETTWNYFSNMTETQIDYEGNRGRTDYPDIGGCYYSSRLAVLEMLEREKRQGSAMLWREIYPGFNIPVGVWYVRENLREMFRSKPEKFPTFAEAMERMKENLKVPAEKWIEKSMIWPIEMSRGLDRFV